jgi:hypothetical protein
MCLEELLCIKMAFLSDLVQPEKTDMLPKRVFFEVLKPDHPDYYPLLLGRDKKTHSSKKEMTAEERLKLLQEEISYILQKHDQKEFTADDVVTALKKTNNPLPTADEVLQKLTPTERKVLGF